MILNIMELYNGNFRAQRAQHKINAGMMGTVG